LASHMISELYIFYRKWKAILNSLCFCVFRVYPIDKRLISVCTFEGRGGFGCNPAYLVRALHEKHPEYRFVWFVNDMNREFPEYIMKVPNTLMSRAYWLTRSKVWIDNYRKPYGTIKRRGQYYLNVNHYTIGIKCTGLWRGNGFSRMAYLVSKNDSDMVDDLVIDSDWCEVVSPKGFVYEGNYLKTGAPRCDVLYGDRTKYKDKLRQRHNLLKDVKIVLFAPTFREGAVNGKRFVYSQIWSIDFKRLIECLEKKFGGEWYICVRVHPQLAPSFEDYRDPEVNERIINESQADDMYEIMAGVDAYISDYSSAIFEAGFAHIPAFVYADDIEKYAGDRGNLMWNIAADDRNNVRNNKEITPQFDVRFPFPISRNNEELAGDIESFDRAGYEQELDLLYSNLGLVFDGKASEKLADVIAEKMK